MADNEYSLEEPLNYNLPDEQKQDVVQEVSLYADFLISSGNSLCNDPRYNKLFKDGNLKVYRNHSLDDLYGFSPIDSKHKTIIKEFINAVHDKGTTLLNGLNFSEIGSDILELVYPGLDNGLSPFAELNKIITIEALSELAKKKPSILAPAPNQ